MNIIGKTSCAVAFSFFVSQSLYVNTINAAPAVSTVTSPSIVSESLLTKFDLPAQDTNGFSLLTPDATSKIIYVSDTDGNDQTAILYSLSSPEVGNNVYLPVGNIKPFKTLQAALKKARDNATDYVLLKRGDEFVVSDFIVPKSGRSLKERSVLATYGSNTKRPVVSTVAATGKELSIALILNKTQNAAIMGIRFYAKDRDPNVSPDYQKVKDRFGLYGVGGTQVAPSGLLIEDCWFDWYSVNALQAFNAASINQIVFRRNLFTNNYSSGKTHAQGLFTERASVLLEDNVFDHNGWLVQANPATPGFGYATIFNQGTYFTDSRDTIFKNNAFFRSSSIANKWTSNTKSGTNAVNAWNILVDNNVYFENEVGMSIGGNDTQKNGVRWKDIEVINNVILNLGKSRPTNRDLAWGIEIFDWQHGRFSNNIFSNGGSIESPRVLNSFAISLFGYNSDVEISKNTIYKFYNKGYGLVRLNELDSPRYPSNSEKITFSGNTVYNDYALNGPLLEYSLKSGSLSNNSFYSIQDKSKWFKSNGIFKAVSDFFALANDKSSILKLKTFADPERSLESFLTAKKITPTVEAYVKVLSEQNRLNWDASIRPAQLTSYIRDGF